jgi:NADPH:quinone reductase
LLSRQFLDNCFPPVNWEENAMRAVIIPSFGPPEVLTVAEVPTPDAAPGQVRIRVAAAALNPADLATRSGLLVKAGLLTGEVPLGLGWDVAGVIDQPAGPFVAGDRVIGISDRVQQPTRTHAEYVVLDTTAVAPAPATDLAAASTLPLNGLTAWQALDLLALSEGQTVLVTGAAGGVGGFTVELAKARGLRVVATAGEADEDLVRGFGAEVFVPRTAPLAETVRETVPGGVDGAVDAATVGAGALNAVRDDGKFIAVVAHNTPAPERGIEVQVIWVHADADVLRELSAMATRGDLTLRVADTFRLEAAAEAHRRLEEGGVRGRLVLVP